MTYLIIGVGGTGGGIGGYLAAGGRDVTLIARGAHLESIQKNGLIVRGTRMGDLTCNVHASTAEEYDGKPDVIFVCVKSYSIDGILPLLARAAGPETLIIPILNVVGTGARIAQKLSTGTVLEGCIYISAYIAAPGEINQLGDAMRVVFGEPDGNAHAERLAAIAEDLRACQIDATVSDNIRRDVFRKYMFISAYASAGAYFDVTATELQQAGEPHELYIALVRELGALADAQGFVYETDMVQDCISRIDLMGEGATTSMQKDLKKGGQSELDGLMFEPVRLGRKLGVETPAFRKVAERFGYTD